MAKPKPTKGDILFLLKVLMNPKNQCYQADEEDMKVLKYIEKLVKKHVK